MGTAVHGIPSRVSFFIGVIVMPQACLTVRVLALCPLWVSPLYGVIDIYIGHVGPFMVWYPFVNFVFVVVLVVIATVADDHVGAFTS